MKKLITIGLIFFKLVFFSQNETTKWYFGAQAGLDFMTSPPTVLTNGVMTTQEGCASIADAAGNLLFYTDGITIWNKLHLTMANGNALFGNGSSTQSAVVIKQPGSTNIYIVFTLDAVGGPNGLRYSLVDMSLAAGNGSVTVKNVLLKGHSSEKLTAVKHCNGSDIWVVSHDTNSNNFRTFLVTAAGVSLTPIISSVGTIHLNMLGSMKASGNGRKLGLTIYTTNNTVEVYDFDNATGIVSNPVILGNSNFLPYGCEFSPNGRLFYACNASAASSGTLCQWDLCAGSSTAIIASQITIATTSVSLGAMQLAANGKIYVSRYMQSTIGLINNPNIYGTGCGYVDLAQSLSPKICRFGLPNFVTSFLNSPPPPFTYSINPALSCLNASFTAPPTSTCGSTTYTISAYSWSFGDPASTSNTSLLSNPTHSFSAPGSYTTQLILYYTCGTDTLKQIVTTPSPTISVATTSGNCASLGTGTVTVSGGSGPYTYSWIASGQTNSVSTNLTPGTTSVVINGIGSGCSFTASALVGVQNYFTLTVSASSLTCNGASTGAATIIATGGTGPFTYSYSGTTQTNSIITGLASGIYTASVTDLGSFCTLTQTFQIIQPSAVIPTISASSPTVCTGNSITFTATTSGGTPGYIYSWSSGPLTNTYLVTNSLAGTYVYTVTSSDSYTCVGSKTVAVDFINTPFLNTSSITICPGAVGTLTATGASTYTWQPGNSTGNSYTSSPSTLSSYTVTGNNLGCISSATTVIGVRAAPTLSFSTFSITCGSLGSATVTASGGVGPFSYTWAPTLQTNSVATGLFPGSYSVSVFDSGTGCVFTPTTSFSALVPLTGTVSASNSLVCNGAQTGSASIALSGGSNSQNYLWSDPTGSQTVASPTNLAAGVNTINVIDALTFCSLTHTFLITQPPAFTLNITASSASVCMGSTITFTAVNSGGTPGYIYSWTLSGPTNTLLVNETVSGPHIYTVVSTDGNNCSITNTINGLFVNNPEVSVSNATICPLAIGTLSAAGATTYNWSNGFSGNPMSISPSVTTQYTVTGTALGCTTSATGTITLKPSPTATFTSNAPVCQGDSLQLLGIGTNLNYLWNGPLSFSSSSQIPATFYSVNPNRSGNYSLKVTAANSCTAIITKFLTVNPTPPLTASGNTVCEGFQLNFYTNYLAGTTYTWTGPPSFYSILQNPSIPNSNPTMTGQYTIAITSAPGCTNITFVQASVTPKPNPIITVNNPNCVGNPLVLSGNGGGSYAWFGPNGFNSTSQNPSLTSLNLPDAGTYSLFVGTGSCIAETHTVLIINPLPIPVATNNSPLCENTTLILNSTGSAQSYTWSGPGAFTSSAQNAFINVTLLTNAGTYTLQVTDSNDCTGSAITTVSILPAPISIANNQTVCLGGAVTLTATGGVNYLWNGPLNYSSTFSAALIPSVNLNNTGTYTVTVTGFNSCSATSTVLLIEFPYTLPAPSISASAKACLNSKIKLHGSGGIIYLWHGPNNFQDTTQDINIIMSGSSLAGIYTLSVKNESNCAATTTILVDVFPLPTGVLLSDKNNVCAPFCANISLDTQGNISPVINSILYLNTSIITYTPISHCFEQVGTFTVNATFKDTNGCANTATLLINAYQKPEASFEHTPLTPLAGIDQVQFYNNTKGSGQMDWTWFLNGNDSISINDKDPIHLFETSGTFPLVLIAKNKWGCADTVIKVIHVKDEFSLYVPNAFTPNGDGLNDIFQPKGQGINKYNIEIYNRWGEQIFHSNDFYSGWDGTYRGKECKTDSYIWKIIVTSSTGNTESSEGNISLLRAAVKSDD